MADKRCENGHFIDETWDICPYCPQRPSEPSTPERRSSSSPAAVRERPAPAKLAPVADIRQSERRRDLPPPAPPASRTVAAAKLDVPSPTVTPRFVVGWLIAINGPLRGESFPVRMGRNVIGRDRKSDIQVSDEQASAHHADLVYRPEEKRYILMDHNSTNGTYVNDLEIEPRRDLTTKDVIKIGKLKFMFVALCQDGFFTWDEQDEE